jgi:hypothetical protein
MVNTLMLVVPWQDCVGFIFLRMACVENMVLVLYGENQGFIGHTIFDRLHMVMFMSINLNETIDDFKVRGKEMVVESFDNLQPGVVWTRYFWDDYCQLDKQGSPFQVWHVLKPFCYGCTTSCMFTFHTYSNYIMG